jgi:hypothetical protein
MIEPVQRLGQYGARVIARIPWLCIRDTLPGCVLEFGIGLTVAANIVKGSVIRSPRHDLTNADFLDNASGKVVVGVHFKWQRAVARKRGGERVERRGHCQRRGFNETVSDRHGASAIESNLGHGVWSQETSISIRDGIGKPPLDFRDYEMQ